MDKITKSLVSVANHQNKSDAKKLRLDETHQNFSNSSTVCGSSLNSSFTSSCKENGAKICDKKNMNIYNRFAKQGGNVFLF